MNTKKQIVLKFGGSVLHSKEDLKRVSGEIQRFVDQGFCVVAVVSAYYGVTEKLIAHAREQSIKSNYAAYADLIASGELQSANDLVSELRKNGSQAILKTPKELSFLAMGNRTEAQPISIDKDIILDTLLRTPIMVVPGYSAVDSVGDCVLLGRGGSDISAVFLSISLDLDSVRLLKDVDGLYNMDPNKHPHARRLSLVDYQTAKQIGGELIQPEAIDFAESKGIVIDVAAIGESSVSRIGSTQHSETLSIPRAMKQSA